MDANIRLKRSADVTFQVVANEAILIRMSTGTYFSLNQVGTEFWNMLDGSKTVQQHAEFLAGKNNRIVRQAVDGLTGVATALSRTYGSDADPLVVEVQTYSAAINRKYWVEVAQVVTDLLEIAAKMQRDQLVEIVS